MVTPRKAPADHKPKAGTKAPTSLIEIVTDESPAEMMDLFSIDGRVYQIPASVSASMALRVLDNARREGMESAMSKALEELLGEEAYQALLECRSLKTEHLQQIMDVVQVHVMGDLELATGN
jgi:hypothetical protein